MSCWSIVAVMHRLVLRTSMQSGLVIRVQIEQRLLVRACCCHLDGTAV